MPTGSQALIPYSPPALSTPTALANVPASDVYVPSEGYPAGGMNGEAFNGSELTNSMAGIGRPINYYNPAMSDWLNKHFPGLNVPRGKVNPSNSDIQNSINNVNKGVQDTHQQISNVQNSIDNNQANNSSLFGFQTGPNACQEIWQFNDSESWFNPVINLQVNAAAGGGLLMSQILHRVFTSVNFLVLMNFCEASQGFPDVENLNAAKPENQAQGQSVLNFLQETLPQYPWEEDHQGTGLVGMDWQSAGDGVFRTYLWSPPPMTAASMFAMLQAQADDIVDRVFHLWDYTPDSGPPVRNGITDFMQIVALLPVQFR